MNVMTIPPLDEESLKSFFSGFLAAYQRMVSENFSSDAKKLRLFSSMPAKIELFIDKDHSYATAVLSSNSPSGISCEKFQDELMCIATANSKKHVYGNMGKFLYLFQIKAKTFLDWNPEAFAKDLIHYELLQFEKSRLN